MALIFCIFAQFTVQDMWKSCKKSNTTRMKMWFLLLFQEFGSSRSDLRCPPRYFPTYEISLIKIPAGYFTSATHSHPTTHLETNTRRYLFCLRGSFCSFFYKASWLWERKEVCIQGKIDDLHKRKLLPQMMVMFHFLAYYAIPLFFIGYFYIIMARHLVLSTRNMPGESQGQAKQMQGRRKVGGNYILSKLVSNHYRPDCIQPTR